MKILIELELSGDAKDTEAVKECVYATLGHLIDEDQLEYNIEADE